MEDIQQYKNGVGIATEQQLKEWYGEIIVRELQRYKDGERPPPDRWIDSDGDRINIFDEEELINYDRLVKLNDIFNEK
jgi:hypothetical protein